MLELIAYNLLFSNYVLIKRKDLKHILLLVGFFFRTGEICFGFSRNFMAWRFNSQNLRIYDN